MTLSSNRLANGMWLLLLIYEDSAVMISTERCERHANGILGV